MRVLEFVEDVMDETAGTGGMADELPVLFEDKEGVEHQIDMVSLTHRGLFLIERKE